MKKEEPSGGGADLQNKRIISFFDREYSWWAEVYDPGLPRGFFSYEMIKRKELVVESVRKFLGQGGRKGFWTAGVGRGGFLGPLILMEPG